MALLIIKKSNSLDIKIQILDFIKAEEGAAIVD